MKSEALRNRTKTFGLSVIQLEERLPRSRAAEVIGRQFLRSAASVGANYRAAFRARSHADFVSKMSIVQEEADGSAYWLELLLESEKGKGADVSDLLKEANELAAIFAASIKTARRSSNHPIYNLKSEICNSKDA